MAGRIFIIAGVVLLVCTTTKALEKSEIKSIINKYEDAFETRTFTTLERVFYSLDDCPQSALFSYSVERVSILKIEGHNVYVDIEGTFLTRDMEWRCWMQFTEDEKIKYDSLLMRHPIHTAFSATLSSLREIENVEKHLYDESRPIDAFLTLYNYEKLVATGIPIVEKGRTDLDKNEYMDVLRWLIDNGATWDATEPKIPLPESKFEQFVESSKKYL